MKQRAIFLDKDGTLIRNVPYNVDPNQIELMPGVEALERLKSEDFKFVIITNQAGVAHGYFEETALVAVREHLELMLSHLGLDLAGFYYCPHHPQGKVTRYRRQCDCRKPSPGLLQRAADELQIDLTKSWLLGDILDDVEAGNRAGCRTILVDVGSETQWRVTANRLPDYRVNDLASATQRILEVSLTGIFDSPQDLIAGHETTGLGF